MDAVFPPTGWTIPDQNLCTRQKKKKQNPTGGAKHSFFPESTGAAASPRRTRTVIWHGVPPQNRKRQSATHGASLILIRSTARLRFSVGLGGRSVRARRPDLTHTHPPSETIGRSRSGPIRQRIVSARVPCGQISPSPRKLADEIAEGIEKSPPRSIAITAPIHASGSS